MSETALSTGRALFRGTGALFLEKRRSLVRVPLWLAFPIGFFASFLARVNHAAPLDLACITFVSMCVCAGLGPIFASSLVTLTGNQVGTRSRRDELLALPIGRLAIPGATLLTALAITLASYAAFLGGLSFFLGHEKVLGAVLAPPFDHDLPFTALGRMKGALGVFAGLWAVATIAHTSNVSIIVFGMLGTLLSILPAASGYDEATTVVYSKLWLASMTGFWLVAPFVLYRRPPHHWTLVRSQSRLTPAGSAAGHDGPAGPLHLAAILALGLLGYLGMGKAVVGVLLLGALAAYRVQRRQPPAERRRVSHLAVTLGLGLAFVAPLAILGLVTDALTYAAAARPTAEGLTRYAISPDGRHVAASFHAGGEHGMSRVLVADLTGREPVRALPPRAAALEESCAWSRDGRWLAVHDVAIGRVIPPIEPSSGETWTYGAEVEGLDQFFGRQAEVGARSLQGTWLLDTQTGSLEERNLLVLAPGWTSPDELLHLDPLAMGGCDLVDGRGHKALWDKPELMVDAYSSDGAELLAGKERFLLATAGGISPVSSASRWQLATKDYPEPGTDPKKGSKRWDLTFSKGERTHSVAECRAAVPTWLDARTVLVAEAEGTVRHDLETGERQLVLGRGQKKKERTDVRARRVFWYSADVPGPRLVSEQSSFIVPVAEGYTLLDMRTGAPTSIPSFPGFEPELVQGAVVLGRLADRSLAVSENGSPPRPVF